MTHLENASHGHLMDRVYRHQRHFYNATRRYFLFGRDRLVADLDARPGDSILELGCGTARNLIAAARRYPGCELHGLDISEQMLRTAAADIQSRGLEKRIRLAQGDAAAFSGQRSFNREGFDRIVLSYTLSMVPPWRKVLDSAAAALAPGGRLLIVDFGSLDRLPAPARWILCRWLAAFHVEPRTAIGRSVRGVCERHGLTVVRAEPGQGYMSYFILERPGERGA